MCGSGNFFKNLNELAVGAQLYHFIFLIIQASVITTTDEATVNLIEQGLHENELTPDQKKCVDAAVKKAREDSPELAKWLDEVESVKKTLQAKAKKCHELEDEAHKK